MSSSQLPTYAETNKTGIRALYGGTFDPPHHGHLQPLLETATALGLNTIELLPAHVPVFKNNASNIEHRLAMTQLLANADSRLRVNTLELTRAEPSYTVDTLAQLKAEQSEEALIFIIGSDSLSTLHKWHNWQKLFDYCHLVVMCRGQESDDDEQDGHNIESNVELNEALSAIPACLALNLYDFRTSRLLFDDIVQSKMERKSRTLLSSKLAQAEAAVQDSMKLSSLSVAFTEHVAASASGKLWLVNNQKIAVSSTFVRMQIQQGKSISKFVPKNIAKYIQQHKLYL